MTDEQFGRLLDGLEAPRRPDEAFATALLDEIGRELRFESTLGAKTQHPSVRAVRKRRQAGRWPLELLLVAALVATASVGVATLLAGGIRDRLATTPRPGTLLAQVRASESLRIAIRPDYPQVQIGAEPVAGFDVDVAEELGHRLGIPTDLVFDTPTTMLSASSAATWDIALPSVPTWSIDARVFLSSEPYYYWTHWLIVPARSNATSIANLAAGPICVVSGDAGEAWLQGAYGGTASSPLARPTLTKATDDECVAALAAGQAVAAVTAHLSAADLTDRAVRSIGGPEPEPRAVVLRGQPPSGADPTDLLQAVDRELAAMRGDGTLARLSESRFGGVDLTGP